MTVHAVTPHPALDVTYSLARPVVVHGVNRVAAVTSRPGGKGVNVARLVAAADGDVAVYGFLGGRTGDQMRADLERISPSIVQRWTSVDTETRRTVAVVDGSDTTMFNEPGANQPAEAWRRLAEELLSHAEPGDIVTISGSLPHPEEPDHLATLVRELRERGAVVVVERGVVHADFSLSRKVRKRVPWSSNRAPRNSFCWFTRTSTRSSGRMVSTSPGSRVMKRLT